MGTQRLVSEIRIVSCIPIEDGTWKSLLDTANRLGVPSKFL